MARLPTPMMVDDLRFTGNRQLEFTVKWASNDPFAGMIDHIYVRFMMTNLLALGVTEDVAGALMESDSDLTMAVGTSAASTWALPAMLWDQNLGMLHRIDYRSAVVVAPDTDNVPGAPADTHEETFMVMDTAFQQRFVRLIAQARTAD